MASRGNVCVCKKLGKPYCINYHSPLLLARPTTVGSFANRSLAVLETARTTSGHGSTRNAPPSRFVPILTFGFFSTISLSFLTLSLFLAYVYWLSLFTTLPSCEHRLLKANNFTSRRWKMPGEQRDLFEQAAQNSGKGEVKRGRINRC